MSHPHHHATAIDTNTDSDSDSDTDTNNKEHDSRSANQVIEAGYRELLRQGQEQTDLLCDPNNDQLASRLHQTMDLYSKYNSKNQYTPQTQILKLDSEVLLQSASCGLQRSNKIRQEASLSPHDFVDLLVRQYNLDPHRQRRRQTRITDHHHHDNDNDNDNDNDEEEEEESYEETESRIMDWASIGRDYGAVMLRRGSGATFLHGVVQTEGEQRKRRVPERGERQVAEKTAKTAPEVKDKEEQEDHVGADTTRKVDRMRKRLEKQVRRSEQQGTPSPLFGLTVDPHSFTKTVENFFYFSFLIKNGVAGLTYDGNDIETRMDDDEKISKTSNHQDDQKPEHRQCVLNLDLETWKRIAEQGNARSSSSQSQTQTQEDNNNDSHHNEEPPAKRRRVG